MPLEYRIGVDLETVDNNNNSSDLVFFTKLVTDARKNLDSSVPPKEKIKYWIQIFDDKYHNRIKGSTKIWTYQICTSSRTPISVCRSAFCAVYGVDLATID